MGIAYFSSLAQAEILEVVVAKPTGGDTIYRLLVDSGFTGQSSFVLSADADEIEFAPAPVSQVFGALAGIHQRCMIMGRIPALSLQFKALAIVADVSSLSLPQGVQGIVGLQFLRQFHRWGAEKSSDGNWRFFLEAAPP